VGVRGAVGNGMSALSCAYSRRLLQGVNANIS